MRINAALPTALIAAAILLSACSSDAGGEETTINVAADDTSCEIDQTRIASATVAFKVTNNGEQTTEVYVYGQSDNGFTNVVSEVENIGPGASRDMVVDLGAGRYEIACKPGQTGDGIRTQLEVTGEAKAESTEGAREARLQIDTSDQLVGVDALSASSAERIEFKVTNNGTASRVFEVKRPDGTVAGETEIAAGTEGELYVDLNVAGNWLLIVEGGPKETEALLRVAPAS